MKLTKAETGLLVKTALAWKKQGSYSRWSTPASRKLWRVIDDLEKTQAVGCRSVSRQACLAAFRPHDWPIDGLHTCYVVLLRAIDVRNFSELALLKRHYVTQLFSTDMVGYLDDQLSSLGLQFGMPGKEIERELGWHAIKRTAKIVD